MNPIHSQQTWRQYPPPPEYDEQFMSPPALYYPSSSIPGSLGTPHIGVRMGLMGGSSTGRRGDRRATPNLYGDEMNESSNITLVATRPLLKALARECRPWPPWCVGHGVPETLAEELKLFEAFLCATPEEVMCSDAAVARALEILRAVWPTVELEPMSTTAAGLPPQKEATLHYYAKNSEYEEADVENLKREIQNIANDNGVQVEFGVDYRNISSVLLTDTSSGKRLTIRFGPDASRAAVSTQLFADTIATNKEYQATLVALDALTRQNKILDDSGINHQGTLNGEALVTMLVSIIKSYGPKDTPDSGRLLMDFFLTFGFTAYFDPVKNSVSVKGMEHPTPKVHRNSQLSILDPSDETCNLVTKFEKVAHIQAVFNYCYTALSQFSQVAQQQHRAQSILSTIIGGESYWSRVLKLYQDGISPFAEEVACRRNILLQTL